MNLQHSKHPFRALIISTFALCSIVQAQSFVEFPAGQFTMGDPNAVGFSSETQRTVKLSKFYLSTTEVTLAEWKTTYTWAIAHGYTFSRPGKGKGNTHPIQTVSWYDAVKWCNAMSEMTGRVPCYRIGAAVYKAGNKASSCDWMVNGFRLPTEAEWERAARAGLSGQNFPWGNNITHTDANYYSDSRYPYDTSLTRGFNPLFKLKAVPYTSPVGSFPSVGGLKDMAGNVDEWCWDRFGTYTTAPVTNPRGAKSGTYRVTRGGGWATYANFCRSSYRNINLPTAALNTLGFRVARSL